MPERRSEALSQLLREDPATAVWWATPVECGSALARLEREQRLNEAGSRAAWQRMVEAGRSWTEVPPIDRVREQALRVLQLHPLRAADALQLAAAIVLADFEPKALPFVTLDETLATAARREGFPVLGA